MSMKSAMRWALCLLVVLAMIAVLGGCAKKEAQQTETTAETTTETATETPASPMAGTYSVEMATGKVTLTLNADMTAVMSMQPVGDMPASVQNGTWAAGATPEAVDVTFSAQMGDSMATMTLNFAAMGEQLNLTNGEAMGLGAVSLTKEHAEGAGH